MDSPKFTFDPIRHIYYLNDQPVTGVTTILGVIAKPALIPWAANMAVDYLSPKALAPFYKIEGDALVVDLDGLDALRTEARSAHRKKKEDAAQKGTDVHALIETIIKDAIATNLGYVQEENDLNDNPQVKKFTEWATQNKVKFLESEKKLYSETLFIAGTTDFTCEIGGRRYVGDLKTSSGIYYEMFLQCAGYRLMLEEMGEPEYTGAIIVRCGKDGSFETKENFDYETAKEAFLGALKIYRAKELYEVPKKY